jgi:hypothetical protein
LSFPRLRKLDLCWDGRLYLKEDVQGMKCIVLGFSRLSQLEELQWDSFLCNGILRGFDIVFLLHQLPQLRIIGTITLPTLHFWQQVETIGFRCTNVHTVKISFPDYIDFGERIYDNTILPALANGLRYLFPNLEYLDIDFDDGMEIQGNIIDSLASLCVQPTKLSLLRLSGYTDGFEDEFLTTFWTDLRARIGSKLVIENNFRVDRN